MIHCGGRFRSLQRQQSSRLVDLGTGWPAARRRRRRYSDRRGACRRPSVADPVRWTIRVAATTRPRPWSQGPGPLRAWWLAAVVAGTSAARALADLPVRQCCGLVALVTVHRPPVGGPSRRSLAALLRIGRLILRVILDLVTKSGLRGRGRAENVTRSTTLERAQQNGHRPDADIRSAAVESELRTTSPRGTAGSARRGRAR